MNTQKVRNLANSALAGFEDLSLSSAVEVAVWNLCEILADVTDDPGSVALIERIEVQLRNKGFVCDCEHNADFTISHDDSNDKLGLQAVDFIAWSLFRHYEHADPQFFDLFKKNVGKHTCWYT